MIALIALRGFAPNARDLLLILRGKFGETLTAVEIDGEHVLRGDVGGARVRVAGAAQCIPKEVLEVPCSVAWYWPEAAEEFQQHRSQLAVVVEGEGTATHQAMLLTRLVSVLGESLDYLGVYWDCANMVHSPQGFSEAAAAMSPKDLPLRLWIDFRFLPEADGSLSMVTVGMETFGSMEIEVRRSRETPRMLLRHAFNAASYVLDGGNIKDDQTVGPNDDERVLVKHEPSMLEPSRNVFALKL